LQEPKELSQIGGVAERLGVSTRTIKYYEELGLVSPENRSPGGFRLYNASDVERLQAREREVAERIAKAREDLKSAEALREELRRDISLCEARMHELKKN
jgi:DNA-binding transcriptional MerR regulator